MSNIAYEAMLFAREKHRGQTRKYTGEPYEKVSHSFNPHAPREERATFSHLD